uniref:Uncharacterized protein n=1 Tax=Anguilla anguilla TaxID=7936 RepID=A0A0E9RLF9_ANGAN
MNVMVFNGSDLCFQNISIKCTFTSWKLKEQVCGRYDLSKLYIVPVTI